MRLALKQTAPGQPKTVAVGYILSPVDSEIVRMLGRLDSVFLKYGIQLFADSISSANVALTPAQRFNSFRINFDAELSLYADKLLPTLFAFICRPDEFRLPVTAFKKAAQAELGKLNSAQLDDLTRGIVAHFFGSPVVAALAKGGA